MNESREEMFRSRFLKMLEQYQNENICLLDLAELKGDEVDIAVEERENTLMAKLEGRKDYYIKKINDAIERIDNGTFGICLHCGEEINENRLNARPTATCCMTCKEEQERDEAHIPYEKKSHTHGRAIQNDNIVFMSFEDRDVDKEKVLLFNKIRLANVQ